MSPNGNACTYTFTVDSTIRVPLRGGVSVYALAGGGFLRRTVEFTPPTLAQTFIYDRGGLLWARAGSGESDPRLSYF